MTDYEDMAMEAQLFPWLDSDCMADPRFEGWTYFDTATEESNESKHPSHP